MNVTDKLVNATTIHVNFQNIKLLHALASPRWLSWRIPAPTCRCYLTTSLDTGLLARHSPMKAHLKNSVTLLPLLMVMSLAIPILGVDSLFPHRYVFTCGSRTSPPPFLPAQHPPIQGRPTIALLDASSTCCFILRLFAKLVRIKMKRVKMVTTSITAKTSAATVTFIGLSITTKSLPQRHLRAFGDRPWRFLDASVILEFNSKMIFTGETDSEAARTFRNTVRTTRT